MKKIVCAICLVVMLASALLLTGCGFFESEAGILISSIEKTGVLADGSTEITIRFTDPAEDPLVFTIPAGKSGETGVGIKKITPTYDSKGMQTEIKIEFTDQSLAPVIFNVTDGKTVNGVDTVWDEDEQSYYLVFKQGDDILASAKVPELAGIRGFTEAITNDDGSVSFAIKWGTADKEEEHEITIPSGNGISYMDAYTDSEGYHIEVHYTNPTMGKEHNGMDSFILQKPADPNQWFTGTVEPTQGVREGDFWFDERNKTIFTYKNDDWRPVINFSELVPTYHKVVFYANDDTAAGLKVPVDTFDYIDHGRCFNELNEDIPIPEREGYMFVGWYPHPTASDPYSYPIFTAYTPVNANLVLYARWEKLPDTPAEQP